MIKAIFFDIDGTLVSFSTHQIPESARQALFALRQKGIRLFIATGRAPCNLSILKKCIELDFDGYVMMNGQYCLAGNTVIREAHLPDEAIRQVIPYLERENIACNFVDLNTVLLNLVNDDVRRLAALLKLPGPESRLGDLGYVLTHPIYQLSAYIPEEREEALLAHLPGCKSARWHESFTDIIPAEGGKPRGMDAMLAHFGLTLEESMAFGDGGNDLDMLAHAFIGVAMGNAGDKTKAAADYVTDDVDHDGILNALTHYGIL